MWNSMMDAALIVQILHHLPHLEFSCKQSALLGTVDVTGHVNMHPVWYIYDNNRMYVETGKESLEGTKRECKS